MKNRNLAEKEFTNEEIESILHYYQINIEELNNLIEDYEIHIEPTSKDMIKWINNDNIIDKINKFEELLSLTITDDLLNFKGKTISDYLIDSEPNCLVLSDKKVVFVYQ